jgi:hypothetical protein
MDDEAVPRLHTSGGARIATDRQGREMPTINLVGPRGLRYHRREARMRRSAWVSVIILVGLHPGIASAQANASDSGAGRGETVSLGYFAVDAGVTELGFFFVGVLKSPAELSCP